MMNFIASMSCSMINSNILKFLLIFIIGLTQKDIMFSKHWEVYQVVTPGAPTSQFHIHRRLFWKRSLRRELQPPRELLRGNSISFYLIGGIPTPLRNTKVNWDDELLNIYIYRERQ